MPNFYSKWVVRAKLNNATEIRNIYYYQHAATIAPSTAQCQAWVDNLYNIVKPNLVTLTIYALDVSQWTGATLVDPRGWGPAVSHPITWSSTGAGELLPYQNAYTIVAKTGVKHVMGRKFLAGCGEGFQDAGIPSAGTKTALQSFADMWATVYVLGAENLTPSTWGTTHGFEAITSALASQVIGSMRRRKPGVGI